MVLTSTESSAFAPTLEVAARPHWQVMERNPGRAASPTPVTEDHFRRGYA